jgi:hypothetical protein
MAGEAQRIRIDRDTTWRQQVWFAFCMKGVGFTRDPIHMLRRLVEEAVFEQRWADAFVLAAVLDREEREIAQQQEVEWRASVARAKRFNDQWIAEEEAKRKGHAPPPGAQASQPVAEPASREEGGRKGGGSAPAAASPLELMMRRWKGEEGEEETERQRDEETK